MPILFACDTMSSMDHDKFRVVFPNDVSVADRRVAEAVQLAMGKMFPEADSSCYKDVVWEISASTRSCLMTVSVFIFTFSKIIVRIFRLPVADLIRALLSKTSFNEGQTIPGIAHGWRLEHCGKQML